MVGDVPVGDGAPVSVQSMTITKTADVDGTLAQIYALAAAGADIVRCTCNDAEAAEGLARIVPRSPVRPLEAATNTVVCSGEPQRPRTSTSALGSDSVKSKVLQSRGHQSRNQPAMSAGWRCRVGAIPCSSVCRRAS